MEQNIIRDYLPYVDSRATKNDLEEVRWVSDYEIYFKFKNGRRVIFDTVANGSIGFYPEGYELSDEEWKSSFKFRLYRFMKQRGITQEQLAEQVGTSQTMIYRYINGHCVPGLVMASKIARALKCSIEDLLYKEY